jgi:hypothetical protein
LQACFTLDTRLSSGICNTNVAIVLVVYIFRLQIYDKFCQTFVLILEFPRKNTVTLMASRRFYRAGQRHYKSTSYSVHSLCPHLPLFYTLRSTESWRCCDKKCFLPD